MATFIAAATSYATAACRWCRSSSSTRCSASSGSGDLIWSAADPRARGFLLGATAGRTTLLGEGLQHQDGHSLLLASTVPTVEAYDPAFAYETAVIIRRPAPHVRRAEDERRRLLLPHPLQRELPDAAAPGEPTEGIIEGLYQVGRRARGAPTGPRSCSRARPRGRPGAPAELAERWDVGAELWSATSYKQLREEALDRAVEPPPPRRGEPRAPTELLGGDGGRWSPSPTS